ncbi:MAG TPA: homoserine O-succinyltransferase [Stellaceae bacterium]|nr:homoserine O-succinyltransferase [Stellaceae bacterium]
MTDPSGRPDTPPTLLVGLVNNMPQAAKRATDEQFTALLAAAADAAQITIRFFSIENDASQVENTLHHLRQLRPDALIITGDEPRRALMADEPLWPCLSRLVDWAAENTVSSVWSCMAAHAAVFRLDQIARKRMPQKLSGMFECAAGIDHPLLAGFPKRWLVPHSRFNYVDEAELRDKGYVVLSHAPRVGADYFMKQVGDSLFVMLQGHPEYAPDSLFREYRRDIRRFLTGESEFYPEMPEHYFDKVTTRKLSKLREQAHRAPSPRLLAAVYAVFAAAAVPVHPSPAKQLYANWLSLVTQEKANRAIAAQWPLANERGAA